MLREPAAETLGLARLFAANGYELALVGGTIRDVFLGRYRPDREFDLATDARPEQVREIVARWADKTWETGIEFGTVGLRRGDTVFEITTYRGDEYQPDSRKPTVTYGRSLEADLARRDFTVNAIAARLPSLELVDPFGGLRDLRARVLRTPGKPEDSFNDDALRMLRAARFAAQLGFAVVPGVQAAMTAMAGRLSVVSAERISAELTKLICAPGPDGPVRGISVLVDTGIADQILPEVPRLRLERDEHFRHKDVYQHSLTVLARAITLEPAYGLHEDIRVRLAALLHDIGKPKTRRVLPDGRVAFHHHEAVGAAMAKERLTALRFPAAVVADVSKLICSPGRDGPVRGISVLVGTGVAEQILPEVPRLRLEVDEHFRHKDVYQHTLTVLARAATLEAAYGLDNDLVVRLAALLHDIGKPETRRVLPDGRVTFHHHEVAGAAMARDRLRALRFPSPWSRTSPGLSRCTCGSTATARRGGPMPRCGATCGTPGRC